MSTLALPRRRSNSAAPRLRPVEAAGRRRPRLMYAVVAVMGAIAIAGAQMAISILSTQSSYQLSSLRAELSQAQWESQMLSDEISGLNSPQYLAANAAALGMVIDESPSYLRLSDGALLGAGTVSVGTTAVNALGGSAIANALIEETPLVTDPDATIEGAQVPTLAEQGTIGTPPPITEGLPTPSTH